MNHAAGFIFFFFFAAAIEIECFCHRYKQKKRVDLQSLPFLLLFLPQKSSLWTDLFFFFIIIFSFENATIENITTHERIIALIINGSSQVFRSQSVVFFFCCSFGVFNVHAIVCSKYIKIDLFFPYIFFLCFVFIAVNIRIYRCVLCSRMS